MIRSYYIYCEGYIAGVVFKSLLPVLMRNEKCAFDVTSIRILPLSIEHFLVVFIIIQIYGTIECEQYNLRRLK